MHDEVDFLLCTNCESPCYSFDLDAKGRIVEALCTVCGNDESKEFSIPEPEDEEDQG